MLFLMMELYSSIVAFNHIASLSAVAMVFGIEDGIGDNDVVYVCGLKIPDSDLVCMECGYIFEVVGLARTD